MSGWCWRSRLRQRPRWPRDWRPWRSRGRHTGRRRAAGVSVARPNASGPRDARPLSSRHELPTACPRRGRSGRSQGRRGRQLGHPDGAGSATQEKLSIQAKQAMGAARRGISTVVERIDPGVLADLIVKATALQEMTNGSLREKRSPYPHLRGHHQRPRSHPVISFAISRLDDVDEPLTGSEVSSAELVDELHEGGEAVISLDGTTLNRAADHRGPHVLADEVTEEPQARLSIPSTSSTDFVERSPVARSVTSTPPAASERGLERSGSRACPGARRP